MADQPVTTKIAMIRDPLWTAKSGIDSAFRHQKKALELLGIPTTEDLYDPEVGIVHINWYSPSSWRAVSQAKKLKIPVAIFAHSSNDMKKGFNGADLLEPVFRRYLRAFYNRADLLITVSNYSRQILESEAYRLRPKVHVVSNGIDTSKILLSEASAMRFRERYGLRQPIVLNLAQLIPRKGVTDFIETAHLLPQYDFVWCGPRPSSFFFLDRATRRAIRKAPKNFHLLGYVDSVADALSAADVFFFPSFEENQGISILEAAYAEKAIVARPLPVFVDWLKDHESAILADNSKSFAQAIHSLLTDSQKRLAMGAKAKILAAEHSLQNVGVYLLDLYQSQLGKFEKS